MGGTIEYVYRDGSRLTPWMLFVIDRANTEFRALFGCDLLVTSGIRLHQEQINIFLDRYRQQDTGVGPFKDVRWWEGKRYVRVKGPGTVAPPGRSNHEIQGSKAAVDLRDSGRDAGVASGGNVRANWLRANATRLGLIPSGYGFGEPWHYDIPNIFRAAPTPAGDIIPDLPEGATMADVKQIHCTVDDKSTGRVKSRALLIPGTAWALPFTESGATFANASATQFNTGNSVWYTQSMFNAFIAAAERCAPTKITITSADAG